MQEIIILGILASLIAGLSTVFGAIPVLFLTEGSRRTLDITLGFSAGVMIAASSFSLLVPALEMETGNIIVIFFGFILGGLFIHVIELILPLDNWIQGPRNQNLYQNESNEENLIKNKPSRKIIGTWIFIIAISVHNFPEGLAVGFAFGSENLSTGIIVTIAILLQNIPEGSAVAFPLLRQGYSKRFIFGITLLTGLVEPIGGAIGVFSVSLIGSILPLGMAFAAGAMIFIVADEIIPESHSLGHARHSTFGVLIGFALMMFLDNVISK